MTKPYLALSIVAPSGQRIAQGLKTLEVRSWRPDQFPLKDLVIVENQTYLNNEGDEELGVCCGAGGFHSIHTWQENEVDAACALNLRQQSVRKFGGRFPQNIRANDTEHRRGNRTQHDNQHGCMILFHVGEQLAD